MWLTYSLRCKPQDWRTLLIILAPNVFMRDGNEQGNRCAFGEFCSFPCLFSFCTVGFMTLGENAQILLLFVQPVDFSARARYRLEAIIFIPLITNVIEKERVNWLRTCSILPIPMVIKALSLYYTLSSLDMSYHHRIINYCFTNTHRHICT